ncbi:MAG: hypothetical protein R2911_28530 [Caldilineaceae bacterium]
MFRGEKCQNKDGIGYGEFTQIKIEHLSKIFGMHLAVTQAVIKKHKFFSRIYRYIDATAGRGFTPDGIVGSPLVFLEQAEKSSFKLEYSADLIEREQSNITGLRQTVVESASIHSWLCSNVQYHHGDYKNIIPSLVKR